MIKLVKYFNFMIDCVNIYNIFQLKQIILPIILEHVKYLYITVSWEVENVHMK